MAEKLKAEKSKSNNLITVGMRILEKYKCTSEEIGVQKTHSNSKPLIIEGLLTEIIFLSCVSGSPRLRYHVLTGRSPDSEG